MSLRSHMRSIAKTASWRAVASIDTLVIGYLLTGRLGLALSVVGIDSVSKIVWFYLHERAWEVVS